jgi:hypothetical protein
MSEAAAGPSNGMSGLNVDMPCKMKQRPTTSTGWVGPPGRPCSFFVGGLREQTAGEVTG